ncbi:hypothetical protein A3Q56_08372 [Intoshia linei]|uniref:PLAT domain-containing protein n=1 Tax=Intoshia linei TaxID=1819745 RepID=A0A177APG0_9BILA|nr:hypothetical protein A3Q56_08372 [Intoshia linei]
MSLIVKKFKRGTAKCIYITATDIGKLLYIELEIYNKNINKPIKWYADSITIQLSNSKNLLHFDCKSWLSNCIADCVQIKTFYPIQYRHTVYQIKTKTGNTKGSGTIGNVFITLYGESCETAKFPLTNKSNNIFNSEKIDTFYFKSICIGPLVKIKIELIPKSKNKERNSWNLLKVNVDDLINKKWNSEFPCNEFLQVNCRKQIVEKILYSNKSFQIDRKKTKYEIEVFTGKNGYTNSNVFINIYGSLGKTGPYYLNTNANNFKSDS